MAYYKTRLLPQKVKITLPKKVIVIVNKNVDGNYYV